MNIPQHVAIILDGNGRWAKAKGMPRNYGHIQGAKTVEEICEEDGVKMSERMKGEMKKIIPLSKIYLNEIV